MLVANNSSEASCKDFMPFYEVSGLPIAMIVLHAVTLVALISHTWAMATRACLDHPVFAVVFQEMVVLSICSLLDSCLLVSAVLVRSERLLAAYLNVGRLALLIHPVSWAVISFLRYHLLIRSVDSNQCISTLRKPSLVAVWLLFFPLLLASLGTSLITLITNGWPTVTMDQLSYKVYLVIGSSGVIVANLPDIFSLAIYFFMWRHFKLTVDALEEGDSVQPQPYGGIYFGPEELEGDVLNEQPQHQNNISVEEDKVKSVMRALGLHLKLSIADVLLTILSLLLCNVYLLSFFYLYHTICFFWLPFLVIRTSFRSF